MSARGGRATVAYLDSSALVKLVVAEPESSALRRHLRSRPIRVSCALARVEVVRAVRRHGREATARARRVLARTRLLRIDDALLDAAAFLDGGVLRSLDAIHLAAAQALGAACAGRPVGSFGTGCFSFYATKNVTTGEGGVVTTDDDEIAATIRILRNQGQRAQYDYARPGFNLRMTELQAGLGVAQMTRLAAIVDARRANAATLAEGLAGIPGLLLPSEPAGRRHVFHQFTVRVTPGARLTRDELLDHLGQRGILAGVYYPRPVFDYGCFRGDPRIGSPAAPNAFRVSREVLSLPVHPGLTETDLACIVDSVRGALG